MGDTKVNPRQALASIPWPKAVLKAHSGTSPVTGRARPDDDSGERRPWQIRDAADDGGAEILLYDEIGGWGVWADEFARDLACISAKTITVRVNSPGGDVWDGIAIMNALIQHPADVTIRVDGLAASIASVICLAGDRVVMGHSAQMMIHNASTLVWGEAADMRQTADLLDQISGVIAQAYADRTGTPVEEWQARMDAETWLTAEDCVRMGLADEVSSLPTRGEPAGVDPDPDNRARQRPAATADVLRPAAVLAEPDGDAPTHAQSSPHDGQERPAVQAVVPAEPDEDETDGDGPDDAAGGGGYDVALLGQALSWWLAVDLAADRMLAQISAALGVPNPDVDSDEQLPPLPVGEAGIAAVLGAFTGADTVVDGAQVILARALGIPNPDPDEDGDDDGGRSLTVADTAPAPPVQAADAAPVDHEPTTDGLTVPDWATPDTPGTGATATAAGEDAAWAELTANLTTPTTADPADVFTVKEGAWWS